MPLLLSSFLWTFLLYQFIKHIFEGHLPFKHKVLINILCYIFKKLRLDKCHPSFPHWPWIHSYGLGDLFIPCRQSRTCTSLFILNPSTITMMSSFAHSVATSAWLMQITHSIIPSALTSRTQIVHFLPRTIQWICSWKILVFPVSKSFKAVLNRNWPFVPPHPCRPFCPSMLMLRAALGTYLYLTPL